MALLLKVIAQHWIKAPPAVVSKLAFYATQAAPKARGMTAKNRRRLRQFDSPENLQQLLYLPQRIFTELKRTACVDRRAALRAQYALAIQVLVVAPMRLTNLTALDLSRHIVQVGHGTGGVLHVVIPGEETKTGEPYEVPVPAETAALLALYRKRYLPLVSAEPNSLLFPNQSGGRRDETAFSTALSAFVKRETGLVINPHLFRHLAVTLYLQHAPDDVETARRLLGHKSVVTTLNFYADIKNDAAFRRYDDVIANLRAGALGRGRLREPKRKGS
ncbi:MAG: tyrosine-type recombinase/integrase [Janthinobacterium lividum]